MMDDAMIAPPQLGSLSIAVVLSLTTSASELARPLMRRDRAQDYGAHPQNWAIVHHDDQFEISGIGPATIHRLVLRHGGTVWAEAAVGEGASFYFTLES
jgi:hypothetical protein